MSYKRLHLRSLHVGKLSVFGDSLPERLRSTSIGLVGVAAATGLILIALVLQQDFPLISGAPVPDPAPPREPVHKDAASKQLAGTPSKNVTAGQDARPVAGERGSAPSSSLSPSPGGIALPVASPGPSVGGAGVEAGPRSQGVEKTDPEQSPAQAPPSSSPAAGTPPVASLPDEVGEISSEPPPKPPEPPEPAPAPEPSHPGNGNAYGKGNGNGLGNDGVPPGQAGGPPHGHSAE